MAANRTAYFKGNILPEKNLAVNCTFDIESFTTSKEREENCFLFNTWLLANETQMFTLSWSDARKFTDAARTRETVF